MELALRGVDVFASAPGLVQSGFAARAGMRIGVALKPADVAQATLDALGCKYDGGARFALEDFDLLPYPTAAFQPCPNDGSENARYDKTPR